MICFQFTLPRDAKDAGSESQETLPSVHLLLSATSFCPPEKSTEEANLFAGGILESCELVRLLLVSADVGLTDVRLFSSVGDFVIAAFRVLSLGLRTVPC